MQRISPTFRRLAAIGSCACALLAPGCARQEVPVPKAKPTSLLVGKLPKPKPVAKAPAAPTEQKPPLPQIKFTQHGVTLNWTAKEGTQMTAAARSASFNETTQSGTLLDFTAKLYENNKLTAAVTAPQAVADTAKRTVTATGGVTLKSMERKTVVTAQWIRWYANLHKIVGDGGVKIKSESGTITGAAFVADTSLKTVTVKDSAKGLEF